jgi:tetratricopeptide (TPR) repeat protein
MTKLLLSLIFVCCATLATALGPTFQTLAARGGNSASPLLALVGDSRRLFANQFFVMADVYFHSGYYPSIFDQARRTEEKENHMAGDHDEQAESQHEKEMDFLGQPTDWIDRFGRHFRITEHTHLEGGNAREILPWLRLSAELDPQRIDTYTVAAYWLRTQLGKPVEAKQFLLEGLRANPHSYELFFELGRLCYENDRDASHARSIWEAALRCWQEQEPGKKEPDNVALQKIVVNLARLEEKEGNLERAVRYLEMAKKVSLEPESLQKQIDELKVKLRDKDRQ